MSRIGAVMVGLTLLITPVQASQIHSVELEEILSESSLAVVICEVLTKDVDSSDQTSTEMTLTLRIVRLLNPSQVEADTFRAETVLHTNYSEPTGIWIDDDGNVGMESPIIPGSGFELSVEVGSEYVFLLDRHGYGLVRVEPMSNLEAVEALVNPSVDGEAAGDETTTEGPSNEE